MFFIDIGLEGWVFFFAHPPGLGSQFAPNAFFPLIFQGGKMHKPDIIVGTTTRGEVVDLLADNFADHIGVSSHSLHIKHISFIDDNPTMASGKIQKYKLHKVALAKTTGIGCNGASWGAALVTGQKRNCTAIKEIARIFL